MQHFYQVPCFLFYSTFCIIFECLLHLKATVFWHTSCLILGLSLSFSWVTDPCLFVSSTVHTLVCHACRHTNAQTQTHTYTWAGRSECFQTFLLLFQSLSFTAIVLVWCSCHASWSGSRANPNLNRCSFGKLPLPLTTPSYFFVILHPPAPHQPLQRLNFPLPQFGCHHTVSSATSANGVWLKD